MRRLTVVLATIWVSFASAATGSAFIGVGVASGKAARIFDVQLAPVVAGRAGAASWALRTWREPEQGSPAPRSQSCLQAGQLQRSRLVRRFASGALRVMRLGDRIKAQTLAGLQRRRPASLRNRQDPLVALPW